jgi:hypothetical protein
MEDPSGSTEPPGPREHALQKDVPPKASTTGIVYRWGSKTPSNLTPQIKDLEGQPGLRQPGLSANEHLPAKRKGIAIDLERLNHPLRAFSDDPLAEGVPGHVSITPVKETGMIDLELLLEWVESRGSGCDHWLTRVLLDAVLPGDFRGPL